MRAYKTQMEAAKKGIITPEMKVVCQKENMATDILLGKVAKGEIAIPANISHKSLSAEGIGSGLRTKINVNLASMINYFLFRQAEKLYLENYYV